MKILIKFPTRSRVKEFIKCIDLYLSLANDKSNFSFLVTLDLSDPCLSLYESVCNERGLLYIKGNSTGKINAVNRDMELSGEWDILVLASDDMVPVKQDWDKILIEEMKTLYPNTDGVLFHNDGHIGEKLNTMCILGRKYFERFNYIYHPSYISLWCDNEFMEVAYLLGKQTYFKEVLFDHQHFSTDRNVKLDELMRKNQSFYFVDQSNYKIRKANNFYLN